MKKICISVSCSVYVFGESSEYCPECQRRGVPMTVEQNNRFMVLYREVNG